LSENEKSSKEYNGDETRWSEAPYLLIKGFLMGSADIVPGVSGGTMALITGIYDRLIYAIKSVNSKAIASALTFRLKELFSYVHWKFILLLLTGIFLAIVFFTRVVPLQVYMFTHPEIVYGLFFGLILGSIILLIAEIDSEDRSWKHAIPLLGGTLFGFWVVTLVPADTPETFWFVMLTGSVSITAMILPGISGSYILLIFRKYDYILSQLGLIGSPQTFDAMLNIFPFALGAIIGLALFSRVLSWLLKNYHTTTIVVLIGFLAGSLYVIWPYQEREFEESVRNVQVLPATDPVVQELMAQNEKPNTPSYEKIRGTIEVEGAADAHVEVQTISRQLIKSEPFIPWIESTSEVRETDKRGGVMGMILGLLMIIGISYLRKKT
jgi:putative membrane protein